MNIWEDPKAAATVRELTGGNETVPSVVVGNTGLVNPSVAKVLDAVRSVAPDLVRDDYGNRRTGRREAGFRALYPRRFGD